MRPLTLSLNVASPVLMAAALAALAALVALAALAAGPVAESTQEPAAPRFGDEPQAREGDYVGLVSCSNGACHGASEPQADRPILGNEYTSRVLDPHFRAYEVLSNELSQEIVAAVAPGQEARDVALCLDCHTVNAPVSQNRGLFFEDGVSCEGCHGPAGGWGHRHFEDGFSHRDSVELGLNDLRQAAVRAQVCLACHQGNAQRTVDHRLLAAGHPVLEFELDNYSSLSELRHWSSSPRQGRRFTRGLRAWAVGQAVAFQEGLKLLAGKASRGPWPAFAELDCASCHHEVGDGSWRRRPGWVFRDGKPPWSPARWAVLRHLLAETDGERRSELTARVRELETRVTAMAPGPEVAELASALARDLAPDIAALDGLRWNRARAERLVLRLANDSDFLLAADEASARQVALSLQSLAGYLTLLDRSFLTDPRVGAIDALFSLLDEPGYDAAAFVARLKEVGEG